MTTEHINSGDLKGRHVIDAGGVDVGAVEEIEIDTHTWGVTAVVVKVNRDVAARLPIKKSLVGDARVLFTPSRIQTMGDNIMLNVSVKDIAGELSNLPPS